MEKYREEFCKLKGWNFIHFEHPTECQEYALFLESKLNAVTKSPLSIDAVLDLCYKSLQWEDGEITGWNQEQLQSELTKHINFIYPPQQPEEVKTGWLSEEEIEYFSRIFMHSFKGSDRTWIYSYFRAGMISCQFELKKRVSLKTEKPEIAWLSEIDEIRDAIDDKLVRYSTEDAELHKHWSIGISDACKYIQSELQKRVNSIDVIDLMNWLFLWQRNSLGEWKHQNSNEIIKTTQELLNRYVNTKP